MKRCRFIPILELLNMDKIVHYIQIITENAVISYNENKMRVEDKEYINGDYMYMVFESENKITYIPFSVIDDQYIIYLKTLIY